MEKANENASLDFKWLKRIDVRINNEVQYYESFKYYGVEYKLYDCVYMDNGDLRNPYIGKLTKMWELANKTKEFEVHWFFRQEEISKWLGETKTLENEIFFATGEGLGLSNINPLSAIVGLCNVVCVSKDKRNPQPSDEQVKAADFVFYRTFDIPSYAILDNMDDKVGGLEIKYVFNRKESEKTDRFNDKKQKDDAKGEPQDKDAPSLLPRNTSFKESEKSHDRPLKRIKADDKCVEPVVAQGFEKMMNMPSMKSTVDKGGMKAPVQKVEDKKRNKTPTGSDKPYDQPFKKSTVDKGGMKAPVQKVEDKKRNKTPTGSDKSYDQPFKKFKSDNKEPPKETLVEREVAHDPERYMEMSSKKSAVDSISKNEDKSRADVNKLKASGTCGTAEDRKNSAKVTSVDLEGKKLKRTMDDGSFKVPGNRMSTNTNVRDVVASSSSKGKSESVTALDIVRNNNYNKEAKVAALSTDKGKKNAYRKFVVSPQETSSWFKRLPWEEDKLKNAYSKGTAILLHNVDPDYTPGEVEDIIRHAFKEKCEANILQHTSVSSAHYAQALILLKTKEAAQTVLTKLDEGCLMLSNGRPLVATPCPPMLTKKNSIFFGHLSVDKARFQNQREDEAVSTSHYAQPNTIEYDMAMEWCFLQWKSTKWWEKFHKQQGLELENLKKDLKKKPE